MKTLTLALLATASSAQVSLAVEHFRLAAAIAHVESSGNFQAKGDYDKSTGDFRAFGAYQLHKAAWLTGGGDPERWPFGAYDEVESTKVAMNYTRWLEVYLVKHDVLPTPANLYASFNVGPSRFVHHYHARISLCPKTTQRACAKLESFLQQQ
jgi:hypothetical protein